LSRILVTGGAGFIGGFLAKAHLDAGDDVTLLDDFSRHAPDAFVEDLRSRRNAHLVRADLTAALPPGLGDAFDVVYHLAAIVGVANVARRPYDVLDRNVSMTANVIAWARTLRHVGRMVFASTSEVYAGTLEHHGLPFPTPETVPLALPDLSRPRTSYMLSKIYGEAMFLQSGLPSTIVRPHNVYGPRMGTSHVVPELLMRASALADGAPLGVHSASHRRTFCYIDDATHVFRGLALHPAAAGGVFNLGNDAPEVTMGELAQVVCRVVGRDLRIDALPETAGSPPRRCPDVSRVRALLPPWTPVPLEDGVRRTNAWYQTNVIARAGAR
jgi:UDP-glucose 4-epimerase